MIATVQSAVRPSNNRFSPICCPFGQAARDAATLSISFTKLSGGVVSLMADGRKVTSQTQLVMRKDCAQVRPSYVLTMCFCTYD